MAARAFQFTASLAVACIPLTLAQGVKAFPGEPDFFCYARKPYDQVINLNSLCKQTPPLAAKNTPKPAATPASPEAKKVNTKEIAKVNTKEIAKINTKGIAKVNTKGIVEVRTEATRGMEFSELNYDDGILVGFVRNKTGKAIGRPTINYTIHRRESDTKWTLIDVGSTRTEAGQLQAGEKSSFRAISLKKGDKIVIRKVEF